MIERIVKRDGRIVAFDPQKITFAILRAAVAVGGRDQATAERVTDDAVRMIEASRAGAREAAPGAVPATAADPADYPTVEEVQDAVEKALIERGHARTAKAYIVYRYEHSLKRAGRESLTYSSDNIPYRKLWETLSWAVDHNCHSLAGVRDYVESGRYPDLVDASEAFYDREVTAACDVLRERLDDVRVMIIAGPSSSGKTTTTIKVSEAVGPRRLVPINVDNYFFDLESHPTDGSGDYDYETPQALDLDLINEHLAALLAGQPVDIPFYNFQTGRREGVSSTIALEPGDILLIDSLHGFFDAMTASVPRDAIFKLYIETLAQIKDDAGRFVRWTDVRMLRRMVRDMQFRNHSPRQTLHHWYLVRRAELRYIVSRLKHADAIVNSFMPSELPIMKRRLEPFFRDYLSEADRTGPTDRVDAIDRARRIGELFAMIPSIDGEDAIGPKSLLREFIGGSAYTY
ncbi:MAG: response regulator SirA [Spirochaetaceae bacterium]|nr:MAG: response regulator SirA [Spirochaetaceae bacterium]